MSGKKPLVEISMGIEAFASEWLHCDRISSYFARMVSHNRSDSLLYANLLSSALNELLETAFAHHGPEGNFSCRVCRAGEADVIELDLPCDEETLSFYNEAARRLKQPDVADVYRDALFSPGAADPHLGLLEVAVDYKAKINIVAETGNRLRLAAEMALEGGSRMSTERSYVASFNENNQEFVIAGKLRPRNADEIRPLAEEMSAALAKVRGTFYLNVKRLARLNNVAFRAIAGTVSQVCQKRADLRIEVVTSSVMGWSTRKFLPLTQRLPNVTVNEYDKDFYPGQSFLEDGGFIPILRNQTKLTWHHERQLLPRHGLKPGMTMADVCCGIGDFAVLVQKEFKPARILALDHSRSSLDYARRVAADFGVSDIEYVYGDASEMVIEDNQFDFVTCRHSLQVFDRPELILRELFRICKPGGRVYVTNEKNSHCLGEPRAESIQWTYNEVARLWADFKMDIELGPKSRRYMIDEGFEDIKVDSFMVTNLDGDPQGFADIIQSWENVYAGEMARDRGDSPEFIAKFRQGFQDHIYAALHPKGYAGWPIWAASGRKPR